MVEGEVFWMTSCEARANDSCASKENLPGYIG